MDGQSIGTSDSATNLPMNSHGWFPLGLAGLILLQSKELSVLQHHNSKASVLWLSAFFMVQLSHLYMTTGKTIAFTIQIFVSKVISMLFNMLSRFVIAFLPRRKCLLIPWSSQPSAAILESKKIKSVTASTFSLPISHEVMGLGIMTLVFFMLISKPAFSLSSLILIKRFFSSLHFLPLEWYCLHIWVCWYFSQQSWFQLVIHPAWHFTSCTLHISLNKQSNNI